ncbi:protein asteroid-like [Physella acuta]|uniref:protein asteroid-like n=1 Tax=Physella acuta TaxID=109671 RepID=UPI0027DD1E3B|nr:protein asteroid-like [Physella acuta]
MGIRGLTGFIDKNQHLLHQHQLHDCPVVLDGNNIYHYLYHACHVQSYFGGDYDIYRKKVAETFQSFLLCGITPYVIMDGAYTRDNRKLKTCLTRATCRIKQVNAMAYNQKGQILPVLAYETFIQVLEELGIPHATCQFEADLEIAVLANKLCCPVISNDSDFYIFDLNGGFLPLDYIDFRALHKIASPGDSSDYRFLHCYKYNVDDFINSFDGLSRSLLPVFASMLGNDFISSKAFCQFYSRVKVPKLVSKKFAMPQRLTRVISVLHWLHTHEDDTDVSVIKKKLLDFIKPRQKDRIEQKLTLSVSGYEDISKFSGFDLYQFFTTGVKDWCWTSNEDFCRYNGAAFPDWFLESTCRGDITPFLLNAAILHRIIILTQVENLSCPPSFICSADIRQIIYGILFKDDPPGSTENKISTKSLENANSIITDLTESVKSIADKPLTHEDSDSLFLGVADECENETDEEIVIEEEESAKECAEKRRESCVQEYNRKKRHLQKLFVEPCYRLQGASIPGLNEVALLSPCEKQNVLMHVLQVDSDFLGRFSKNTQLYFACVLYWVRKVTPKITFGQLDSLIVCVLLLKAQRHLKKRKAGKKRTTELKEKEKNSALLENNDAEKSSSDNVTFDIDKLCVECKLEDLEQLCHNLDKYHKKSPSFNNNHKFQPQILHAFAQLQAVLSDTIHLYKVLQSPFTKLYPAQLLNGTFLYNFSSELTQRTRPDEFITAMLGRSSPINAMYNEIRTFLLNCAGVECFEPTVVVKKSKKKKTKAKSKKKVEKAVEDAANSDGEKEEEIESISGFDIANKFSLLCMD